MVILAIGLLALAALGVSAVRSLSLAQRNSAASVLASQYVEEAIGQLSEYQQSGGGTLPQQFCLMTSAGKVSQRVALSSGGQVAHVTVTVTPRPGGIVSAPFVVISHYYSPKVISGSAITGSPCAS